MEILILAAAIAGFLIYKTGQLIDSKSTESLQIGPELTKLIIVCVVASAFFTIKATIETFSQFFIQPLPFTGLIIPICFLIMLVWFWKKAKAKGEINSLRSNPFFFDYKWLPLYLLAAYIIFAYVLQLL